MKLSDIYPPSVEMPDDIRTSQFIAAWASIVAFVVYQPPRSMWGGHKREDVLAHVATLLGTTVERLEEDFLQ